MRCEPGSVAAEPGRLGRAGGPRLRPDRSRARRAAGGPDETRLCQSSGGRLPAWSGENSRTAGSFRESQDIEELRGVQRQGVKARAGARILGLAGVTRSLEARRRRPKQY